MARHVRARTLVWPAWMQCPCPLPSPPPPPCAEPRRAEVEAALRGADVFFGSLLFDFDQARWRFGRWCFGFNVPNPGPLTAIPLCPPLAPTPRSPPVFNCPTPLLLLQVEWLRARIADIPYRLVFESALELMGSTRVGTFTMGEGGQSKGPPPAGGCALDGARCVCVSCLPPLPAHHSKTTPLAHTLTSPQHTHDPPPHTHTAPVWLPTPPCSEKGVVHVWQREGGGSHGWVPVLSEDRAQAAQVSAGWVGSGVGGVGGWVGGFMGGGRGGGTRRERRAFTPSHPRPPSHPRTRTHPCRPKGARLAHLAHHVRLLEPGG